MSHVFETVFRSLTRNAVSRSLSGSSTALGMARTFLAPRSPWRFFLRVRWAAYPKKRRGTAGEGGARDGVTQRMKRDERGEMRRVQAFASLMLAGSAVRQSTHRGGFRGRRREAFGIVCVGRQFQGDGRFAITSPAGRRGEGKSKTWRRCRGAESRFLRPGSYPYGLKGAASALSRGRAWPKCGGSTGPRRRIPLRGRAAGRRSPSARHRRPCRPRARSRCRRACRGAAT